MKHSILLINLDKSTDRFAHCQQELAKVQLKAERISAVYGADLSQQQLAQAYSYQLPGAYHKALNPGEVGCYLSHRKAWQRIIDQQLDFAIILEDDFIINGDLPGAIEQISKLTTPWDYIKLAEHQRKRSAIASQPLGDFTLVNYRKVPARTCAQAVSLSGAKKLLAHSQPFKRPVDIDLQHWWEKSLHLYGLTPCPIEPKKNTASEIDKLAKRNKAKSSLRKKFRNAVSFTWRNWHANRRLLNSQNNN